MTSAKPQDEFFQSLCKSVSLRKRILYIGSHPQLLQRRRQELLRETGGWIGVRWLTLSQFIDKLLHSAGKAYVRITQPIREEIVESVARHMAAQGQIPHLQQGLAHPGMSKSLALWIEDVSKGRGEGWRQACMESQEQILQELGRLATAYFSWTETGEVPYKETEQLYRIAAAMLREQVHPAWMGEQVFIEGGFQGTEAESALLNAIQETASDAVLHIRTDEKPVWPKPNQFRWYQAESASDEMQLLIADLTESLRQADSDFTCAIVVPNEEYRKRVIRELPIQVGLPHRGGASLIHEQLVQKLLLLLQLKQTDGARGILLQVASALAPSLHMSRQELAWGRELLRKSGIICNLERARSFFRSEAARARKRLEHLAGEGDAETVRRRLQAAQSWLRMLGVLQARMRELPAVSSWAAYARVVTGWLDKRWLHPSTSQLRDWQAAEQVRHLLLLRERIAKCWEDEAQAGGVPFSHFVQWFQKRVGPACTGQEGWEEHRFDIWLPGEIYGARVDKLFVLGLADELLPSSYAPHWIWELVQREPSLSIRNLPDRQKHEVEQLRLLAWVMEACAGSIVAYSPRFVGRGQPASPCRFLLERYGEPEQGVHPPSKPTRHQAVQNRSFPQPVPVFSTHQPLHATGLDLYRRCPFRFFAERTMRVSERLERQEGMTALDRGEIVHRTLRKVFEEPVVAVEDTVQLAQAILSEELDQFESRWHLSGMVWESQKKTLQRDFATFVQAEAARVAGQQVETFAEWGFGLVHAEKMSAASTTEPLNLQRGEQVLQICGIVDRVDVAGGEFSVVDYKLSSSATAREMQEGEDWQVALYLLAFHRLHPVAPSPKLGRYAVLRDPGSGGEIAFAGEGERFEEFAGRLEEQVFQVAGRLLQGDVTPNPWKESECQACSLQSVCRYQEIRHGGA